jgi:hypothetical protein
LTSRIIARGVRLEQPIEILKSVLRVPSDHRRLRTQQRLLDRRRLLLGRAGARLLDIPA